MTVVALCQNVKTYTTTQCKLFVNFETGGICIHRNLQDAMNWIMQNLLVVWFTDIFTYLVMQTEL